ncbi:MAG: efflux RND transporter periplasmic adaptor subunit [Methylophilaceae bacterium]
MSSNPVGSSNKGPSHRTLKIVGIGAVIVLLTIVVIGVTARASTDKHLNEWTKEQAITTVSVISPSNTGESRNLDLPGRFEAFANAPIYARVSGYLKSWNVDIGTPVKAGQLLGEIETPDLDQQLLQAKADLASYQANVDLAAITSKRIESLLDSNSVSRQEFDDKAGDLATKKALLQSAQANLDRIQATKAFTRIVAPFDGIVTARTTDIGALINVGSSSGPALFVVSDTKKLRLYVSVPQSYAASIKTGSTASISVPEYPGKSFKAIVASSSKAVDASSGTTLMQLAVDNTAGELLPGGYAKVTFDLPSNQATLNIPSSALILDKSGLRVATVGADNKVALKSVEISRDLGKVIELSSGVDADDRVIDNPPDGIVDGEEVHIKKEDASPAKAG